MRPTLLRHVVIPLLIGCGLIWVAPAHATITCSTAAMSAVSFGTVNPLSSLTTTTATLTYTCSNSGGAQHSATLCFSIGEPGGGQENPRLMKSGTNTLGFQLYQSPGYITIWGSQYFGSDTPLMVNVTLAGGGTTNGSAILDAEVLAGQTTAIPSATPYADDYANGDTALTINDVAGATAPSTCGGTESTVFFPFNVTATVEKNCTVTANNLSLGSVAAGATPASNSSSVFVTCSGTTPYFVGMAPLNVASTTGAGTMKGTGTNTNTITYQLYSNAGLSTVWGNTATSTAVGNGVAGTGTGAQQTLTVYAKATGSTDVKPDTYTDTVQVNVNY